ncbi:hypothetical protein A9Q81_21625 [Gammaproteobacteria bacterium 42_54_T18]|nr:hypothetical protein A9Q81_21625 [Gammaproteobacteria bacterium 42_54_T18]
MILLPGVSNPMLRITAIILTGFLSSVSITQASGSDALYQMDLEQLMDLPVTSVNKRPSSLAESAAAVYVITNEDIRRSGEVSLPDVLALAPGVDVIKTNASTWGVGIRGFNGQYSNKLLVLVDGRSIYSVLGGSVFWDIAMPLLDDIERIEVIRGPGASLWGSNAVNGVISIITKSAVKTQGQHVVLGVGSEDKSYSRMRSGGTISRGQGSDIHYRLYGQTLDRDSSVDDETGQNADDAYKAMQLGVRLDWAVGPQGNMSVQSEWYHLDKHYNPLIDELIADGAPDGDFEEHIYGGHVMAHWTQKFDNDQQYDVQFSIDEMNRDESLFEVTVLNVDVDFQHSLAITKAQQLTWGVSYRYTMDEFRGRYFVSIDDDAKDYDRTTAFVQDEVSLADDWAVVLGVKLEETEFASFDTQPTLRVIWTPSSDFTVWTAVSKANRTPNRVGKGVVLEFGSDDQRPSLNRFVKGSKDFVSETLYAYELGVRSQVTSNVFVDFSGFYFEYKDLRTFDLNFFDPELGGSVFTYDNDASGYSSGGEAVVEWKVLRNLSINVQYSYIDVSVSPDSDVLGGAGVIVFEEQEVNNIAALRCEYTFDGGVEFDVGVNYRDGMDLDNIKSQTDFDMRLAWRYSQQLAFSLIGKNIGGSKRVEFTDTLLAPRHSQIEPSATLQVDMHF